MKPKAPKTIHKRFKKFLESSPVTMRQIQKETGISPTHLSFILTGDRPLTQEKRQKLNNFLKTSF